LYHPQDIWAQCSKIAPTVKREVIYVGGTFGIAAWLAGMKFIDRSAGKSAGEALNCAMLELKEKKEKLWIFPEGTRRNTGEIHEFKKGAFHAAIHAQVPIIPVVYSSYKHVFDAEKNLFQGGTIEIQILPAIPTKGLTKENVDELIQKTRDIMIEMYNKN
jgi:lysophosphatidate acyltransferase